jgi:hypothetical protein
VPAIGGRTFGRTVLRPNERPQRSQLAFRPAVADHMERRRRPKDRRGSACRRRAALGCALWLAGGGGRGCQARGLAGRDALLEPIAKHLALALIGECDLLHLLPHEDSPHCTSWSVCVRVCMCVCVARFRGVAQRASRRLARLPKPSGAVERLLLPCHRHAQLGHLRLCACGQALRAHVYVGGGLRGAALQRTSSGVMSAHA